MHSGDWWDETRTVILNVGRGPVIDEPALVRL